MLPLLPLWSRTLLTPKALVQSRCALAEVRASLLPESIAMDVWPVFAILAAAAATGRGFAQSTVIGRALSAPICAMVVTFAMTATGVLPTATPVVTNAQGLVVSLATPLLLLNADLRTVGRRASQMVPAFLIGTVGTLLGAIAGITLLRAPLNAAFGVDGLKVACALAAKNIGGGLNFVAVAAALSLSPLAFTTALAVDNVMALVYFPLVASLGRGMPDVIEEDNGAVGAATAAAADDEIVGSGSSSATNAEDGRQGVALAVGLVAMAVSRRLADRFLPSFDLPIVTILTVAAATLAPRWLGPLAPSASELGTTCIFLFFATAGWTGGSLGGATLLSGGPVLLGFLSALYTVHLVVLLGAGALARRARPYSRRMQRAVQMPLLLVASNANIGGPATASALATGNGWPSLVTPALLVGNAGYAIATPICVLLHSAFKALGA